MVVEVGKKKIEKTNALRILDQGRYAFDVLTYDVEDGAIDGISVAHKIGCAPSCVFKTLVTQGVDKAYYVFVIPVSDTLDLKKSATVLGVKKLEMIPVNDILKVTGYIRGGCSPIGMRKSYKTIFHKSCLECDRMVVSAGRIGLQLKIAPKTLIEIVGGLVEGVI